MSESPEKNPAAPSTPVRKRCRWLRILGWTFGSLFLLAIVLIAGLSYYTTTEDFQKRVGKEVVSVLEDSTGGKVEIGHIAFNLWHLAIEVDGLVIHGKEGPGEMPYLSADKIFVRVKINTFLAHASGHGPHSHVGVNYLRVEQPHVHLIIDKDGNTNQPEPKHPTPSNEPVQDTLLDLQATKVELANGLLLINDRAIPFDAAANDLNAEVHYISSSDRYGATLDLADLRTRIKTEPEVQSKLHMTAELGRDAFQLQSFDFDTGNHTHLSANALIEHFAKPEWQADAKGAVDLKQLGLLAGIDGFTGGAVDLDLHGRNCVVAPAVAQKNPHFWQRHNKTPLPPSLKMLPPDPDCKAGYLLIGSVQAKGAGYRNPNVRVHDVNAKSQLRVTPTELLFSALTGSLPGGGTIDGQLKIENWLGEVPANAPAQSATTVAAVQTANTAAKGVGAKAPIQSVTVAPVARAHAYATVTVNRITLRTILEITASPTMGDLGLDTQISGPVTAEWGGPATDIASSLLIGADLKLSPSGVAKKGAKQNIPVSGIVLAKYDGRTQVINIQQVNLTSPATTLAVNGVLGVNNGDPLTNLQVNLQARDLGEFDQTLQTVGFEANGKKGSAAIPVVLHGTMGFTGTAKGAFRTLDVKGHLTADNFAAQLGTAADVHIDSLVADGEYAPNTGVAVASSTIKRGTALLNLTGTFVPRRAVGRGGVVSYEWDTGMSVNVSVKLADAQATDLLQIAGQANKVPLTGTVTMDAHAAGAVNNLNGAGNISLSNGALYGENYQTISVDLLAKGEQISASKVLVRAHGMSIAGSGSYNVTSKRIQAQVQGNNLRLSNFDTVKGRNIDGDAVLSLNADANGTLQEPNLHAQFGLSDIVVQGKPIGDLKATAYSTGSTVFYDLHSTLVGAQVTANGQTSLQGDFQTQAKLMVAGLDVAKPIALFAPGSVDASSVINGTVTVSGPAAKPMQLTGNAEFNQVSVTVQGVELKTVEPLRASLHNGVATLDQLHITGPESELRAGGTATLFGDSNPQGGPINLNAAGNVNLSLLHTFDRDLTSSGKVNFKVGAEGRLKSPSLTGNVDFQNANLAMDGVPNGLSNLNGTMVFNENRLQVQNLTGVSGGGKITVTGFVAYQKGLYANLTANADNVRMRLYGLSTTANANINIQGGPQSLLMSGNVLITRFGVGPDVDFAAFAGAGGIPTPPDPDAMTSKIRMDVHVTSSPQLDFQNSYAKLAGTVDLTVRGTIAQPSILGTVRITDGSATFAGTKYQLDRGVIYFSNPIRIDPAIDLDVSTRVSNYDVTVGLHGTASNLKPTYRSEPPLTEADIFNLLALGRTQEQAQINQEQQIQAGTDPTTSAVLGGALNATVGNRVGKLFGSGSVKIDPAFVGTLGNSSARITVQEPLSKQLTLVFATNVNQSAQQLIQVQYQINDSTSLVATRDENGVFSVVYKIRKRYK
ncbi:MAG TPA: translocation/assembly module TamB domain-containing protein [Acidobacteriaceae bacterium]|jgi:translocation and assembly module TamB